MVRIAMTNTTTLYRTQATETITVSTVLVREDGARWYETTIVVGGAVSDGERTSKKYDAGFEHDAAVAWARGYRDAASNRHARWDARLVEVSR